MSKKSKSEKFRESFVKFHKSSKSAVDYMDLLVAANMALRQGSGLVWSEVDEIVRETLAAKSDSEQEAAVQMVNSFLNEGGQDAQA